MKKSLLLFFVCLCFEVQADWYVATNGDNTTGDGTLGNPWKTIRHGLINMTAGEPLYMRGGNYPDELFTIEEFKSGPSTNSPTILQSYPGEWAVVIPKAGIANGINIHAGKSNILLSSFSLDGTNCGNSAIKLTGLAKYITLTNLTVHNTKMGHGILTSGAADDGEQLFCLITHCRLLTNGWGVTSGGPFHQIYLQHSEVTVEKTFIQASTNTTEAGSGWGIHYYTTGTNLVLGNNMILGCIGGGIGLVGSSTRDARIFNNIILNSGVGVEIRNSVNVSALNNTCWSNGVGMMVVTSTNVTVENNIPVNNQARGIWVLSNSDTVFVRNSLGYSNTWLFPENSYGDLQVDTAFNITTNANLFNVVDVGGTKTTNSTLYDAKFVFPATNNFRVLAGSSAIGNGKAQSIFNTDFGGNVRSLPWTIGAWQFLPANSMNIITARIGTGIILGP